MTAPDPLFRCTVCGQEGSVGRCCGTGTHEPLNDAARKELAKAAGVPPTPDPLEPLRRVPASRIADLFTSWKMYDDSDYYLCIEVDAKLAAQAKQIVTLQEAIAKRDEHLVKLRKRIAFLEDARTP